MPYNARNHWTAADPNGTSGYDGAGNMLTGNLASASQQSLIYDAEERLTQWEATTSGNTTTVTFTYDGDGRRVKKTTAGGTTVYVYDPAGNLAAEYGGALSNVGGTVYLPQDHLGSTRLVTNQSGGAPQQVGCHDYLPFGEEIPSSWARAGLSCYSQATDAPIKFTGKERDAETWLDFFGARYMSSAQGRFTSADAPFADQDPSMPQSWNLYRYVRNNPLRFIDPSGRDCVYTGDYSSTGVIYYETGGCSQFGGTYIPGTIDWSQVTVNPNTNTLNYGYAPYDPNGNFTFSDLELPDPGLQALQQGALMAEPGVNLAAAGAASVIGGNFAAMAYGAIAGGEAIASLGLELLPSQARNIQTIETIIADHVTMSDLAGGAKEAAGFTIRNGGKIYNHQQELRGAATGLARAVKNLQGSLNDPTHGTVTRQIVQQAIQKAETYLRMINAALGR